MQRPWGRKELASLRNQKVSDAMLWSGGEGLRITAARSDLLSAGLSLRDVLSQLYGWAVCFEPLAFTGPGSDELVAASGGYE